MDKLPRYTLRIPNNLHAKIEYIARNEGRTKNKELEQLIKNHIREYERLYGEIPIKNQI